jgi:hypothetical protein
MSTKAIVGILVAVVAVAGGGYYLWSNQAAPAQTNSQTGQIPSTSQQVQGQTQTAQAGAYSGSLADLAARGGTWKCSVNSTANDAASSGTTYVSGNLVRADFTTTVASYGKVESHLIVRDGYTYTWSPVMPQGIKTSVTSSGQGSGAASGQGANANASYSYDCQPWTADASLFVLPTNVTFRAM